MEQRITIKTTTSIADIGELNKLTESLFSIDEIYRSMKRPDLLQSEHKMDFRIKVYKDIEGAKLTAFRVSSPVEIVITVDSLWIGALTFVLLDYKTVKDNIRELHSDIQSALSNIPSTLSDISGLADTEIQNIEIGVRLFCEHLLSFADDDLKKLLHKIQTARRRINYETIEKISVRKE